MQKHQGRVVYQSQKSAKTLEVTVPNTLSRVVHAIGHFWREAGSPVSFGLPTATRRFSFWSPTWPLMASGSGWLKERFCLRAVRGPCLRYCRIVRPIGFVENPYGSNRRLAFRPAVDGRSLELARTTRGDGPSIHGQPEPRVLHRVAERAVLGRTTFSAEDRPAYLPLLACPGLVVVYQSGRHGRCLGTGASHLLLPVLWHHWTEWHHVQTSRPRHVHAGLVHAGILGARERCNSACATASVH